MWVEQPCNVRKREGNGDTVTEKNYVGSVLVDFTTNVYLRIKYHRRQSKHTEFSDIFFKRERERWRFCLCLNSTAHWKRPFFFFFFFFFFSVSKRRKSTHITVLILWTPLGYKWFVSSAMVRS